MIRLLWIDDNLGQDLIEKRTALDMEDDIDAHFARDASDAYYLLRDKTFDVVIFDLLLPPGADDMWNPYRDGEIDKFGLVLLKTVKENKDNRFDHLNESSFGVFTIETKEENKELFKPPISLPEKNFKMKTHAEHENALIEFIRNVYNKWM